MGRRLIPAATVPVPGCVRAAPAPTPCRAARSSCRTWATGRTRGSPTSQGQSRTSARASRTHWPKRSNALPGDAHSAGVPIVDEDGGQLGLVSGPAWRGRRCPSGRTWRGGGAGRSGHARWRGARRADGAAAASAGSSSSGSVNHRPSVTKCWAGRSSSSVPRTSLLPIFFFWKAITRLADHHRAQVEADGTVRALHDSRPGCRCRSPCGAGCGRCRRSGAPGRPGASRSSSVTR